MFYDKEQVDSHLNCKNCHARYDIPRLLTCGEIICETCLNNIKNIGNTINEIKCPFCLVQHNVPKNGFPIQRIIFSLLKIQPLKKFRGVLVEELHDASKELSQRLNRLNVFNESSQTKIKIRSNELRKLIAATSEKKRNELRNLENIFNQRMNLYEKEAFEQINSLMQKYIEENEQKFKIWNKLAENDNFANESKLLEAIHEISDLLKGINTQKEALKTLLNNLEVVCFESSKEIIDEATIGVLKIPENDFDSNDEMLNESRTPVKENNIQCKTQ